MNRNHSFYLVVLIYLLLGTSILSANTIWQEYCASVNPSKTLTYYKDLSNKGIIKTQYCLGVMYESGIWVPVNKQQAFHWISESANAGFAQAQNHIGYSYYAGELKKKDYSKAYKWYERAAKQNYSKSQNNLGYMLQHGYGVTKDIKQAKKWYQLSADQGNRSAQYRLAVIHHLDKNYEYAFNWFILAANQNQSDAQNFIGTYYQKGNFVVKDDTKAAYWYLKSAKQDNGSAQKNLGVLFTYGDGVKKDYSKAIYWLNKAVENNIKGAKSMLAHAKERQGFYNHLAAVSASHDAVDNIGKTSQNCNIISNERRRIACMLGDDVRNIKIIETKQPSFFEAFSKPQQKQMSSFCARLDYKNLREGYLDVLADTKNCSSNNKYPCDLTRANAYSYGRDAIRSRDECNSNFYYDVLLRWGRTICFESATNDDQKLNCEADFGFATGIFN